MGYSAHLERAVKVITATPGAKGTKPCKSRENRVANGYIEFVSAGLVGSNHYSRETRCEKNSVIALKA